MHRLPDWRVTMPLAHTCARCGARTSTGTPCRSPAMCNGRCRLHGGYGAEMRTFRELVREMRGGCGLRGSDQHPSRLFSAQQSPGHSRREGFRP